MADIEADVTGEAPVDGRAARAARTRAAIVDALLALLQEGELQPTATRIAERAGTSLRLIYHHFGDLESLFTAVADRSAERVLELVSPIDPGLARDERIDALVAQRAAVLEWITPVRRAAQMHEPTSDSVRQMRDQFYAAGEAQVAEVFRAELDTLPRDRRRDVHAALSTVLSWGAWNDLRQTGRTPDEAAAAVRTAVRALLAEA